MKYLFTLMLLFIRPSWVLSQVTLVESGQGIAKPGESMRLTCTVTGYSISTDYCWHWIRQPPGKGLEWLGYICYEGSTNYAPSLQSRITISKDDGKNQFYLQMSSLIAADSATYFCARDYSSGWNYYYSGNYYDYGFGYWGQGTMVTVTSATPTAPAVFPLTPCCEDTSSASQVTMGCLISGYFPNPATVQWNSGAISSGIRNFPALMQSSSGLYMFSSQLTVPGSSWQSGTFQCNVVHEATSSTINKKIEQCTTHAPVSPEVQLLHSSCSQHTDAFTIQLVCLVSRFYPNSVTVNWLVDGKSGELPYHTETAQKDATGGTFSTTSTANVTQVAWKEGKKYTCQVIHQGNRVEKHASRCPGGSSEPTTDGAKISITRPNPLDLYMNGDPKLVCLVAHLESDVGLTMRWSWEKKGSLIPEPMEISSGADGLYTAKSSLMVSKQSWLAGDVYTCIAEHPDFAAPLTMPIVKKSGKTTSPHVYLFRPHNEELRSRDPNVCITCLIKGFNPEDISIRWLENHNVMSEGSYVVTPVQLDSSQDSYFVFSMLTIPKTDWNNGHSYTCHVVHEGLSMKYTQRTIEKAQGKK